MTAMLMTLAWFAYGPMTPPPQYDHPFKGKVIIQWMDACKGCSGWTRGNIHGVCKIYILKTGNWLESVIIRHEIAHCNGWRH